MATSGRRRLAAPAPRRPRRGAGDRGGLSGALQELLGKGAPTPEAIAAFLGSHRFPLVEGTRTTFVYRGPGEKVRLRHFIYGLPSSRPLHKVDGTDLWYVVEELP